MLAPVPDVQQARSLSGSLPTGIHANGSWFGVSWRFPETDLVCGPGIYSLKQFNLALSLPRSAGVPVAVVPIVVTLYRSSNETFFPTSVLSVMLGVATISTTPSWVTLELSSAFTMDLSDGSRNFAIAFHPAQVFTL